MTLLAHCGTQKISREELKVLPIPEATKTHKPVAHHALVAGLVETLGFRHIDVVRDEYAVSPDGMRMFGVLDLDYQYGDDVRFDESENICQCRVRLLEERKQCIPQHVFRSRAPIFFPNLFESLK